MFDKLDQAVDHMTTVHQLDNLKFKIAKAKATTSPTAVCPVLSCLSLHSPGLHLPASHSLTQLQCAKCKATALKVNTSKQMINHNSSYDSSLLPLLQCKLCLVTLPQTDCGVGGHFN